MTLSRAEIEALTPDELVNKLWDKRIRLDVERALVGGLGKTQTQGLTLRLDVRDAVLRGLNHWSLKVRWWCLQIIDHHGDETCFAHVPPLLQDAVPRVRKMAHHALVCEGCSQTAAVAEARQRVATAYLG